MTELEGLLDDIRQNPEDDTPRLVAADWYEEEGDAVRAAFIRDSVTLERLPEWDRSPSEGRRLARILRSHGKRWLGDARGLGRVGWHRGFPDSLCLTASSFLKRPDPITQTFRAVSLSNLTRSLPALASCTALRRIRSLCLLGSGRSNNSWTALFRSPHLEGLRVLEIKNAPLTTGSMAALGQAPFLPRLEELRLDSVLPGASDLASLRADHLRRLTLSRCNLNGERLEELRELPGLMGLTHLTLAHSLGRSSGPALARWTHLCALQHLDLDSGDLHTVGAAALAHSTILSQLRELRIVFHDIGDRGIEALLRSPHLGPLESLDLSHSDATANLGRILAKWAGLSRLRELSLSVNALRETGLKALLASRHLSGLRTLHLGSCGLGGGAGAVLGEAASLTTLRRLVIWGNDLGEPGATALIRSPHLQQLEALEVTEQTFSKRARESLKAHFGDRYLSFG